MSDRAGFPEVNAPGTTHVRRKVCEACGATFDCRAGECWCDEVRLADEARAQLRTRYADCLCPTCLLK